MKIYIDPGTPFRIPLTFNNIELVNSPRYSDFSIKRGDWNANSSALKQSTKEIYCMPYIRPGRNQDIKGDFNRNIDRRSGFCVDDKRKLPMLGNFSFSFNDFCIDPLAIVVPTGFNLPHTISKPKLYWQQQATMTKFDYFNRVYWKGSVKSHESRSRVYNFFKNNDSRFFMNLFNYRIYTKPCPVSEYDNYIKELLQSDMCFNLRGDRPSTHSFFDIIQNGCIPININCMDIGWEKIMNNVGDYMLNFDLRTQSMDEIYTEIVKVLEDRERVLKMKQNCVKLFDTFFKHLESAWSEFFLAKCIEIYKNDFDQSRVDNVFISPEILELKNIKEKI